MLSPWGALEAFAGVADLAHAACARRNAVLFHHGFDLCAFFGTQGLHAFARVRHLLPVNLAFGVNLPQSWFDRRSGLRLRRQCCGCNRQGCYEGTESSMRHKSFLFW